MVIVNAEFVCDGKIRQLKPDEVAKLIGLYRDSRFLSLHSYDSGLFEAFVCKVNGRPVRHAVYSLHNSKLNVVVDSDIKLCDVLKAGNSLELIWLGRMYSVRLNLNL